MIITKFIKTYLVFGLMSSLTHADVPKIAEEIQTQIFLSAKFHKTRMGWESRCSLGNISYYGDLNKDGRPDAIVLDGGTKCYGNTGIGFYLITQQTNKQWTRFFNSRGTPEFLKTMGRHGWPDIAINDNSQCFQVYKWDGQKFQKDRLEYKGRTCTFPSTKK